LEQALEGPETQNIGDRHKDKQHTEIELDLEFEGKIELDLDNQRLEDMRYKLEEHNNLEDILLDKLDMT
jgi:hypothetical protein